VPQRERCPIFSFLQYWQTCGPSFPLGPVFALISAVNFDHSLASMLSVPVGRFSFVGIFCLVGVVASPIPSCLHLSILFIGVGILSFSVNKTKTLFLLRVREIARSLFFTPSTFPTFRKNAPLIYLTLRKPFVYRASAPTLWRKFLETSLFFLRIEFTSPLSPCQQPYLIASRPRALIC